MSTAIFVAVGPNNQRVGIVFRSFKDFVQKCSLKFGIKLADLYVTLEDDTEVDEDYFEVLQDVQELYIKSRRAVKPPYLIHQLAEFLHKCLQKQPSVYDKVTQCLQDPSQATIVLGILAQVAESSSSKRADDTTWFKGLNTKFRTKEAVLRNSAETRMRSYLEQAKKALLTGNQMPDSPFKNAIEFFRQQLSKCHYNANYFDRSAHQRSRLCDKDGLFKCEGPYNKTKCDGTGLHFINPYASRESRIIFSTWNLDHVIEKSRTILPLLKKVLEEPNSCEVNLHYFHELLFSHQENASGNLKLVHIACHDKRPHEAVCDHSKIYKIRPKVVEKDTDVVDAPLGMITRLRSKRNLAESSQGRPKRPRLVESGLWPIRVNRKVRSLKKKA